jgi:hypothetical protein
MFNQTPNHPLYPNTPLEIGTAFEFLGVSFPTVFKNNLLDNSKSRGLYMAGMDFNTGANGVIIGPQIDFSLIGSNPWIFSFNTRDNTWGNMNIANGGKHTDYNNVDGGYNIFYMTYPTSGLFTNTGQPSGPTFEFQSAVLPNNPTLNCITNRKADYNKDAFDDIALDSIIKLGGNDTSRYFGKEFLYSQIRHNDTLTAIPALASFKLASDNTNLRYIDDFKVGLQFPLDSLGIDSLMAKLNMIVPQNNVELNYTELYDLILKNPEMRDSIYLPEDIDKLKAIAQLCPFTDGNAVYMARVILHGFDPKTDYYNYCEFAKDPRRTSNERLSGNQQNESSNENFIINLDSEYQIVPNPNDGTFRLNCNSKESIKCELYDVSGRIIESGNYKPAGNSILFNFDYLPKGMYHLKVINNEKAVTLKIIFN